MIYIRGKPCPHCRKMVEIHLAVLYSSDVTDVVQICRCKSCNQDFNFKVVIDVLILPIEPRTKKGSLD